MQSCDHDSSNAFFIGIQEHIFLSGRDDVVGHK